MLPNPFYRVQKRRYPNLRKTIRDRESQKSQNSHLIEHPSRIFKNASLSNAVEEDDLNIQRTNEGSDYYEMRSYFHNKYNKYGSKNTNSDRRKSTQSELLNI